MSALDVQVGGDHYKSAKIQPVQYIEANGIKFLEGCVIKRCTRHDKPSGKGRQDIEKAIHELQLLLELRYGEQIETTDLSSTERMFSPPLNVRVEAPWMPHVKGQGNPARHDQMVDVTFANGEIDTGFASGYVWTSGTTRLITHWRPHTPK